jgi:N-acetylglutamate synthase-like GNAT family acetyltransferase
MDNLHIRQARLDEIPTLTALIEASVRALQTEDYTQDQRESALIRVFGVDTQLVADGTYLVVETESGEIAGCGGWSKRRTLYGSDRAAGRDDTLLDPARDAAKIRAFFIHPAWARRGLGTLLLNACEEAAMAAGFRNFEMGATLTGEKLFRARGYAEVDRIELPLGGDLTLPVVRMRRLAGYSQPNRE